MSIRPNVNGWHSVSLECSLDQLTDLHKTNTYRCIQSFGPVEWKREKACVTKER